MNPVNIVISLRWAYMSEKEVSWRCGSSVLSDVLFRDVVENIDIYKAYRDIKLSYCNSKISYFVSKISRILNTLLKCNKITYFSFTAVPNKHFL